MSRSSGERYGLVSRGLHWSVALLIIGLLWLGWYMVDLTYYDRWYNASLEWHKVLGMLVLCVGIVKIFWALVSHAPAPTNPKRMAKIPTINVPGLIRDMVLPSD